MSRRLATSLLALTLLACQPADHRAPAELLKVQQPCEVDLAGCTASDDKLTVRVKFDKDFAALKPFHLQLTAAPESPIQIDEINLEFSMQGMRMGLNKYRLLQAGDNVWTGKVTLPICTSGRSDWLADFDIQADGQRWKMQVPFVLEK